MKKKKLLLIIAIISISITGLAYLLDNDPPYENISATVIEFTVISSIFFLIFSGIFDLNNRMRMHSKVEK